MLREPGAIILFLWMYLKKSMIRHTTLRATTLCVAFMSAVRTVS